MTQVTSTTASDQATEGRPPFYGEVSDVVMVDRTQARLFASLGRARKLFENVASWPSLESALAERSRAFLAQEGEERWSSAGGVYGPDGEPTCRPSSPLAAGVVGSLAREPGGLLWQDSHGHAWAVRLVPAADRRDPGALFGFAIGGRPLEQPGGAGPPGLGESRQALGRLARGLRLAGRAEQLLWALHCAVVSQRRSVVLLPDLMLGQVVWGGDRACWPDDWRHDVYQTLASLAELRSEVLRLSSEGWQPQLGAYSVAVAHVEKMWVTRPDEDGCRPCCPMWGQAAKHCHFLVQPGHGFLGVMEKFACGETESLRLYDFKKDPPDEAGHELKEARRAGELVTVSATAAVLGHARWSGLSEPQVRVVQALVGETTRVLPPRKSARLDGAEVFQDNCVPGRTAKEMVCCPLLAAEGAHIAFCGNGRRRGQGYTLVGENGDGGWLGKCGYAVQAGDGPGLLKALRHLLADLGEVRDAFGLTVAGLLPRQMRWLTLEDMASLARSRTLLPELLSLHVRVYGPEDFHDRCRAHLAERGSFSLIPGAREPSLATPLELGTRIRLAGIRQVELAARLGVSQPFVSQLLAGRKWPERLREKAEALVQERLGPAPAG